MRARLWTAANVVMLIMFVFSAAVQINDPDPVAWIGIYLAAAAVCAFEIKRKAPRWAPAVVALIALVWSGYIAMRARDVPISALFAEWEMRNVRVEEAREMYGLAILAVWMIVVAVATLRRDRTSRRGA
jgi:hypothetical protein